MTRRVLVADDEPSTAEMLALMLGFTGFEVDRAYDGEQALRIAREVQPDVILLDVKMPKLDGPDVTREVRADPQLSDKVIVLFSSSDENDVDWRESGADAFLQKPIDIRCLPRMVTDLIDARAARKS